MHPASLDRSTPEQRVAYALLRSLLGVDLFGHGLIRTLHGATNFAAGMVKQMVDTPLPPALISPFGYAVPWVELVLGSLLILGLATRATLVATMLFMTILMFGITLKQDWATAGLQLGYGVAIFLLMYLRETNDRSWLTLLRPGP